MLTRAEARQRCAVNNCDLHQVPGEREFRVVPRWLSGKAREDATYRTDCLLDAAIQSGRLGGKSA